MARVSNETKLVIKLFKERAKARIHFLRSLADSELEKSQNIVQGIEWAEKALESIKQELIED